MSFTDLGKATGLSTSAVHQRVKRLEQRGLILGYGATVNHDEIGLPLTAFISIRPIDPSQPDDSPARLEEIPEIESCWSVAGDESYILKVRLATPERPRGPAGPDPRRRQRLDPHHDRALDLLREPPRHWRVVSDRRVVQPTRRAASGASVVVGPRPKLTRVFSTPAAPPYVATPRPSRRPAGRTRRGTRARPTTPGPRRAACGSGRSTRRCGSAPRGPLASIEVR